MKPMSRALLVALMALSGCHGFNLDPGPQHEFSKADASMTAPPADLLNGRAR